MLVKVLYFGRLKEIAGSSEESVEVREGERIEELFARCSSSRPELREFAAWDTALSGGDEVGFLPPVSGG
jgi:molybdopterin converting factor small subunit